MINLSSITIAHSFLSAFKYNNAPSMQNDQSKTYFLIIPKISLRKHLVICKSIRERLTQYAASNASGKPHCDFAFLPLPVVHAKMLVGDAPNPK
jgi:uncharacterized CHY-type Zn-finger protein